MKELLGYGDIFSLDSINGRFEYFVKFIDKHLSIGVCDAAFIVSEECMIYYDIMKDYEKTLAMFMIQETRKGRRLRKDMEDEFIFSLIKTKKGLDILKTYDFPYWRFLEYQFVVIRDQKIGEILDGNI